MREKAFKILKRNKGKLNIQQYRTIKGQILKGDYDGAIRGIERVVAKRKKEMSRNVKCENQK